MNWFAKFKRWLPIKYHPKWQPKYVVRDGIRLGPFLYSTKWTDIDNFGDMVFGDSQEEWRKILKKAASNSSYDVPDNPVFLARAVYNHLMEENKRWRDEAINAKKEISKLKREKGNPE